jgi:hypothetical protein
LDSNATPQVRRSFPQMIFILPALLPISTLSYQLVILLGRIVSARRIMCLHGNILLVYRLLGLDIASLIHTYRTNRCYLTMMSSQPNRRDSKERRIPLKPNSESSRM